MPDSPDRTGRGRAIGPLLSNLGIDVDVTPELPEFDEVRELMIADFGGETRRGALV